MPDIKVSPQVLRDTGAALVEIRQGELIGDPRPRVHYLHGPPFGDPNSFDRQISTGGFEPGAMCQYRLGELYQQALGAFYHIYQDMFALASGAYLLADVYHSEDHDKALLFAFLEIEDEPRGLPSYIDAENNSRSAEQQAAMVANGGPLPPGWEAVPYTENAGLHWMVEGVRIYDADGNLVAKTATTTYPDSGRPGHTVSTVYDQSGAPRQQVVQQSQQHGGMTTTTYVDEGRGLEEVERVEQIPTAYGGSRTETYTAQRDGQGNLIRDADGNPVFAKTRAEVHNVIPSDRYHDVPRGVTGGAPSEKFYNEYYVETYDENGRPERVEETTIGPQFPPPESGTRHDAAEEQMARENEIRIAYGHDPDQLAFLGVDEPPPPPPPDDQEDDDPTPAPGTPGGGGGGGGTVTVV